MKSRARTVDRCGRDPSSPACPAWLTLPIIAISALFILSACTAVPPEGTRSPAAAASRAAFSGTLPAANTSQISIYTPATTTSVPVILVGRELARDAHAGQPVRLTVFSNHSQANTLFLRGDVDILVTGLSVGIGLFKNGAPIQVLSCNVSGLTYLVTYGRQVKDLSELEGGSLYVPFEGSPIEETSRFFAEREGLVWNRDIKPVYAPSDSALALLKQGKGLAAALPEPFVSLAEQEPQVHVDFAYRDRWNKLTGSKSGYPQVCAFARKGWVDSHKQAIDRFNKELANAIRTVQRDPAAAVQQTEGDLALPQDVLLSALRRTEFNLLESDDMVRAIGSYYQTVGKPLDESYGPFFFTG